MTGPAILLGGALIVATMLEIDFRHQRRALQARRSIQRRRPRLRGRRCRISRQDARWLRSELNDPYCPVCDRLLAEHSR